MSTPVFIPEMLLLASLTDSSVSLFMSVFYLPGLLRDSEFFPFLLTTSITLTVLLSSAVVIRSVFTWSVSIHTHRLVNIR